MEKLAWDKTYEIGDLHRCMQEEIMNSVDEPIMDIDYGFNTYQTIANLYSLFNYKVWMKDKRLWKN